MKSFSKHRGFANVKLVVEIITITLFLSVVVTVSTSGTSSRRILSERTVWITSKTKGVSITEEPNTNKEIEIKFVLIGGGIIILMFIFVIVIQLYTCKSSRSAKFKPLKRNRKQETLTPKHYTGNVRQGNEQSENQKQLIQTIESDYQDIEESIELRALPVSTGEYISPIQTSQPQTSYCPLTSNDILQSQKWNDQYDERVSELVDENKSNLYLHPINV